jgi:hypothetical protein
MRMPAAEPAAAAPAPPPKSLAQLIAERRVRCLCVWCVLLFGVWTGRLGGRQPRGAPCFVVHQPVVGGPT